jgi:DNA-directed RNA polymerase subunit RPC12/RpoP
MFAQKETNGIYVSDECYKMALTDALSVACKALGVGADVYWQKDNTKYNDSKKDNEPTPTFNSVSKIDEAKKKAEELLNAKEQGDPLPFDDTVYSCTECGNPFVEMTINGKTVSPQTQFETLKKNSKDGRVLCRHCREKGDK